MQNLIPHKDNDEVFSQNEIRELCVNSKLLQSYILKKNYKEKLELEKNLGLLLIEISSNDNLDSLLVLEGDSLLSLKIYSEQMISLLISYSFVYGSSNILFHLLYSKLIETPKCINDCIDPEIYNLFAKRDLWLELSSSL